jgi:hypothetical protein
MILEYPNICNAIYLISYEDKYQLRGGMEMIYKSIIIVFFLLFFISGLRVRLILLKMIYLIDLLTSPHSSL